jgi:drug/metabolite transporter (DMT)-like permease
MYRLIMTVGLLSPIAWRSRQVISKLRRQDWIWLSVSGLLLGLHFLFWIESLKLTSVASSMILMALQPVFVLIGAYYWFRERPHWIALMGILVALIGAILIAGGDVELSPTAFRGDFLSILGTLSIAAYMLVGQRARQHLPATIYSTIVFAIAGLLLGLYNIMAGVDLIHYDAQNWLMFALLAVIPTVFGHAVMNWLLRYLSAAVISVSILGEPIGAIVLAYVFLHQSLFLYQIIGGLLTLSGVGIYLRIQQRIGTRRSEGITAVREH